MTVDSVKVTIVGLDDKGVEDASTRVTLNVDNVRSLIWSNADVASRLGETTRTAVLRVLEGDE